MNNDNGGPRAAVLHFKEGRSEVEGEAPLAGLLGLVHGTVGPVQQIVDVAILARMAERTADAAGEGQQMAGHVGRYRHGCQQPLAQGGQLQLRLAQGRQYDGELVAGQARHHVAGAHLGTEHVGKALQQGVADMVAELIVDPLEAV